MVIPRDIRQRPISKDRHALIGPWVSKQVTSSGLFFNQLLYDHEVLRNIFGPVNLEVKRQNAAVPLRSLRGTMDKEDSLTTIGHDEYDFLKPMSSSSSKVPYFDDLPSEEVSQLIHTGLVFWPPKMDDLGETKFSDIHPDRMSQHDFSIGHDSSGLYDGEPSTEPQPFPSLSNFQADEIWNVVQGQHDVKA